MNISEFLTKKVNTKEEAVSVLSEFVSSVSTSIFPGSDHGCRECGYDHEWCECTPCEECENKLFWCECKSEKENSYDECLKEADAFAKKWNIPFDIKLHKSIIKGVADSRGAIWNSSSAYC